MTNKLRKIAEAATPGPWVRGYLSVCGRETYAEDPHNSHLASVCVMAKGRAKQFSISLAQDHHEFGSDEEKQEAVDATYIATFDPPTVLALLDLLAETLVLLEYSNAPEIEYAKRLRDRYERLCK